MSAAASPADRWEPFLARFFGPPNSLGGAQAGSAELDAIVEAATRSLSGDEPLPLVLPARIGDETHYLGVAFDRDQARLLRELLMSHVGTTWTDFDGVSRLNASHLDELDHAAIAMAGGDPACVFRFRVAPSARAKVRSAVRALMDLLVARPPREARIRLPIGRLLGDFDDACAAGAEQAARAAYAKLAADHRISAANRLYLQVQLLAALEQWDEMESMSGLQEVLRLDRPTLASDALAKLALRRLATPLATDDFIPVARRFGALVPSVGSIRSVAGARYYVLWALHSGEGRAAVRERLEATGWAGDEALGEVLAGSTERAPGAGDAAVDQELLRVALHEALDSGRLDTAVEVLGQLPIAEIDLPVVIDLVRRTLTANSIELFNAYRRALGEDVVRSALNDAERRGAISSAVLEVELALPERVAELLRRSTDSGLRASHRLALAECGLAELLVPGSIESVTSQVRAAIALPTAEIDLEDGIDACLDLARDVRKSGAAVSGLGVFGSALVELWAFHDQSGDRRRLRRIVQLVDDALAAGVAPTAFEELVEFLRAGWDPFLTDADLEAGLDSIELLLTYRPDGSRALDAFARPLLARIGPHNAQRLPAAALDVAMELAPLFGMEIPVVHEEVRSDEGVGVSTSVQGGTVVAVYSLMEQAAGRAARILRRRHPALEVVVLADHVASDRLRSVARTADLVVVVDRAAKHAATEALRAARGSRPTRYAAGKGATSLIEAVEAGLEALAPESAA